MHRSLVGLILLLAVSAADAATTQSCTVSNSAINFGIYDPLNPANDDNNAGSVQISCKVTGSGTALIDVALGAAAGTLTQRRLVNGTNFLNYNIYTNPSYTTIWGDGTAGTFAQSGALSKTVETMSWVLYGRIPAGQLNAAPGTYTDTVQVTVTF
jgi:spore coat protein U-like protein